MKKLYIKGFEKNLTCRGYQFEIGKEYKIESDKLELCTNTVFHFCENIQQVHEFYSCNDENNRYCYIDVLGKVIKDNKKCGSNHIKIVSEIKGEELDRLLLKINGNTGLFNTGYCNTGDCNTGDCNTGDWNTGDRNTGDWNTGDWNTGNRNTGYRNTGDCNTGYWNTGDWNTGYRNTGYRNTGDCNTGNWNTGYRNTGDCNTGDWNTCNRSTGLFNTKERTITIFNVDSGMTYNEFYNSKYFDALYSSSFDLTKWVYYTEEEKKDSVIRQCMGGYLKEYTYEEACENWWNNMTEKNRKIVMDIPNFDKNIFKEITGIDVKENN